MPYSLVLKEYSQNIENIHLEIKNAVSSNSYNINSCNVNKMIASTGLERMSQKEAILAIKIWILY